MSIFEKAKAFTPKGGPEDSFLGIHEYLTNRFVYRLLFTAASNGVREWNGPKRRSRLVRAVSYLLLSYCSVWGVELRKQDEHLQTIHPNTGKMIESTAPLAAFVMAAGSILLLLIGNRGNDTPDKA